MILPNLKHSFISPIPVPVPVPDPDFLVFHTPVGRSLSVGACLFLDPEVTEHRVCQKKFPFETTYFSFAGIVAFLSS